MLKLNIDIHLNFSNIIGAVIGISGAVSGFWPIAAVGAVLILGRKFAEVLAKSWAAKSGI